VYVCACEKVNIYKILKFSRREKLSSEEELKKKKKKKKMQLSVPALQARATTRTTTRTTSGREGEFSSGTSSLFVRRSEREAKKTKNKTNATPRALFNTNTNDDGNKKRTRRRASSSPKPKPLRQGDLTKKRCDACLGAGKIPCYNCTRRTSGWESGGGNAVISVADKVGYVPAKRKKTRVFSLPFGWKTTADEKSDSKKKKEEEEALVRCPVCETVPGKLVCGRCNGQGSLLYRSADWR
jgi:hypothetical protein